MIKSKHDSWIFLKDNSPFESIKHLFPEGFPVISPFPMQFVSHPETGLTVALWTIDSERLNYQQLNEIVFLIAKARNIIPSLIHSKLKEYECLSLSHQWCHRIACGREGMTRQKELAIFQESFNGNPPEEDYLEFFNQQKRDWIDGNKEPDPYPQSIDDIPRSLRTPELEQAINHHNFVQLAGVSGLLKYS